MNVRPALLSWCCLLAVVTACSGPGPSREEAPATVGPKAEEVLPDGGFPEAAGPADAGTPPDAGSSVDAGTSRDAGTSPDAGTSRDAGTAPDAGAGGTLPAQRLDLSSWKLTLPVDTSHPGSPDEIRQPELATYSLPPHFQVVSAGPGVVFQAHAGGATTSGSGYPRSELREMTAGGGSNASWSTSSGTHTLEVRQAITHLPVAKPHVVAGQIHDASDDVVMVRLEGTRLFAEGRGVDLGTLDSSYVLGRPFTLKFVASGGRVQVHYDGVLKVDHPVSASGCYFKAGCYTQSNPSKGDAASAYGEVVIYELHLSHQ